MTVRCLYPVPQDTHGCDIELEMIDGIPMKSKRIIPLMLQKQILQQLHNDNMDIEKDEAVGTGAGILGKYECRHKKH